MSTVHLGSLGNIHEDREITFSWFNTLGDPGRQTIRVSPVTGELDYVQFLALAAEIPENDEIEGMKVIMGFLRDQIDPRDWDLFWRGARAGRQRLEDLMNVSKSILEAVTDFPTGQPSESSAGRQKTQRRSKVTSSGRGGTKRERATERALVLLKGRPDLQMAVLKSAENRQQRALRAAG